MTAYSGVILAAGRGSRMAPFSESWPKPLLPVCNKPIIEHQIAIMKSLGISDIVVLVGHKGFEISRVLGDGSRLGVSLRYAEQTSTLGIAHAVGLLESHIQHSFLLMLGDVFFIPRHMQTMMETFESQECSAVLAAKEEPSVEAMRLNFAIHSGPDGLVTRVVEKPRHSTSQVKGVGIYLFAPAIFDAIRRTPRTAMRDEYEITESIQVLINDGHRVAAELVIDDDVNLTTPADLLRCNLAQARRESAGSVVAGNARVHPDATIEHSVIGDRAVVRNPIRIARSVIFEDTHLDLQAGVEHVIVTPERMVDCSHEMRMAGASS